MPKATTYSKDVKAVVYPMLEETAAADLCAGTTFIVTESPRPRQIQENVAFLGHMRQAEI
jgi:hypothetical protein